MTTIYVDGDACPVKDEVYKVAGRYGLKTVIVANDWFRVPESPLIEQVIVEGGLDVADDWIADQARTGDVVITADIPLAARAIKKGARVIGPTGKPFTERSIGAELATRNLMTSLRDAGTITTTNRPFSKKDRSQFLQALDTALQAIARLGK